MQLSRPQELRHGAFTVSQRLVACEEPLAYRYRIMRGNMLS